MADRLGTYIWHYGKFIKWEEANIHIMSHVVHYGSSVFDGIRAYDMKARKTRLPGPLDVQIQTIDRCNASCIMCPYSATKKYGPVNFMEKGLYDRILNELRCAKTVQSFTPMLQNEPLLDSDLAMCVKKAKEALGDGASVYVVTNGVLLTRERAEELIAVGTHSFSVSLDAFREETYQSIRKGLAFSKVIKNI